MENAELKVLIFCINEEHYATDIMEIERILGYENPTKIPDLPDFIEGVINYQDDVIPIISLAKRFHVQGTKDINNSKIIVSKQENAKVGMIVDLVSEVKTINSSNIEKTPEIVSGISQRYIKGLLKIDGRIIIFLNLASILSQKEKELL